MSSSIWPFSNTDILNLLVSEVSGYGFHFILKLSMSNARSYYFLLLLGLIVGRSMLVFVSAERQLYIRDLCMVIY